MTRRTKKVMKKKVTDGRRSPSDYSDISGAPVDKTNDMMQLKAEIIRQLTADQK